jgi:predicted aspartyl protease
MIEIPLKSPLTFFVRLKGERGVRELRATLKPFATLTVVPYRDMLRLGYPVVFDPRVPQRGDGRLVATMQGEIEVPPVTVDEIMVGDLVAKNVESVAYDLPNYLGTDVILGESFLKNFVWTLDYHRKVIRIEAPSEEKTTA